MPCSSTRLMRLDMRVASKGLTSEKVQHLLSQVILANSADKVDLDAQPAKSCSNICWGTSRVWDPRLHLLLWHSSLLCQAIFRQDRSQDLAGTAKPVQKPGLDSPNKASPRQGTDGSGGVRCWHLTTCERRATSLLDRRRAGLFKCRWG